MLRRTLGRLKMAAVYLGAAACLVAMFFLAQGYAGNAQQIQRQAQDESLAQATGDATLARVKIVEVFTQPLQVQKRLRGTVEPYEDINLAVKAAGAIEWLGVREGDTVSQGQKLMEVDKAILEARLERERAALALAKQRQERFEQLAERGVTSRDEFDNIQAAVVQAEAAFEEARVSLEYATLTSPIDGVVDRRLVDQGEFVAHGQTVMRLVDISRVEIMCDAPEKDVMFFHAGQEARVVFDGHLKTHEFTGPIEYIALSADRSTRTYPLKIIVDNPDGLLRGGYIVQVYLTQRDLDDAIAIPFFTILDREDSKSVFVVEGDRAVERRIEFGVYQGGLVEITSGLEVGDRLVVVGQRELVNGEKVNVTDDLTALARQVMLAGGDLANLALQLQ